MNISATRIFNDTPEARRRLLLTAAALFVLALGARVAFIEARGVWMMSDSDDYVRLAENSLAHGAFSLEADAPFTPSIRRAPLYPVFLMAFVRSGGTSTHAAALAQAALDAATALMVLLLAYAVLSLRWAAAVGLAYAIHPGAIYFASSILSETLFTTLTLAGTMLLLYGLLKNRIALTASGGVVFGLAALCRPIALPLPFLFCGLALLVAPRLPRRWLHAALLVVCAVLTVTPWTIRCSLAAGQFVFVQGATPVIFYVATRTDWNQQEQETLWTRFMLEDEYGRRFRAAHTPKAMAEADRFGLRLGLQNIRSAPRAYLASRVRSFPHLFITSFDPFTGMNTSFSQLLSEGDIARVGLKLTLLLLFSLAPFLLGIVGLLDSRRNLAAAFCATVWLYTWLINLPMWVEYRYWAPVVPFLLVSAAVGARQMALRLTARRGARSESGTVASEVQA